VIPSPLSDPRRLPREGTTVRDGTVEPLVTPTPTSEIIYAIGDIHGMDDLLARMLAAIVADIPDQTTPHTVVFLGDVVNRGPQTRQVLDRLIAGPTHPASRWIVLRGNHEQAMLDALTRVDENGFRHWLRRGGMRTLASYGGTHKDATRARARVLVGKDHLAFLASLPLTYLAGDHLFVHAGVAPGVPLAKQSPATLMNIRSTFLKKRHRLPFTVVHGHTPTTGEPLIGPGRIGVDAGACMTGILMAIAIDNVTHKHWFLRVSALDM
jgi:serine/threonine protein phosphatase 1